MALCYTSAMKKTTVYLDESDYEALALIQEHYGTKSESAALRLALRMLADQLKKGEASHVRRSARASRQDSST
jgi:Arc/MetJ family transcription regulator